MLLASVAFDLWSQLVFLATHRFPAAVGIADVGTAEALHVFATRARADTRRIRAFHRTAHRLVLPRPQAVALSAGRRSLRVDALRPAGIRVVGYWASAGHIGRLVHLVHSVLRRDPS